MQKHQKQHWPHSPVQTEEMSEWKSMCEESVTFYVLTGPLCGFMMTY